LKTIACKFDCTFNLVFMGILSSNKLIDSLNEEHFKMVANPHSN
jgi:hypothetical protein